MTARLVPVLAVLLAVFAVTLRTGGITNGPVDIHHVRQSDTASIARNMAREGIDLLHPRIDWAGPDAGTVESELPLYNALVAVGWPSQGAVGPSGYAWARGVSIGAWFLGGVALFLLVRRRLSGPAPVYLLLYAFSPLAVVFSRNIQPDALAVCLLLFAIERADAASEHTGRNAWLGVVGAGLLGGLAIAVKGTTAFFVPIIPLILVARAGGLGLAGAGAAIAAAVVPAAAWYWHAAAHLGTDGATFGIWGAEAAKWGSVQAWLDVGTWRPIVGTLVSHTATPIGLAAAGLGLAAARTQPELRPFAAGVGLAAISAVLVADGYHIHSYYQLVWVPFLSVVAGEGLLRGLPLLRPGQLGDVARAAVLFVTVVLFGLTLLLPESFLEEATRVDRRVVDTGKLIAVLVSPGEAVLVVDRHPQSVLYAADRRGFHRTEVTLQEAANLREAGADFIFLSATSPSREPELVGELYARTPSVAHTDEWDLFPLGGRLVVAAPGPGGMEPGDDDSAKATDDSAGATGDDDSSAPAP